MTHEDELLPGRAVPVRLECPRCHRTHLFGLKIDPGGEASRIAMSCPCGGEMVSPPGVTYIGRAIAGVAATLIAGANEADLKALAETIQQVRKQPATGPEEVADALEATGTDAGRKLGQWVRDNGGWLAAASLIVTLLQLLQACLSSPNIPVDEIVRRVEDARPADHDIGSKQPRNAPCQCGSGLKFKNCHGLPESVQRELQEKRQRQASSPPQGRDLGATEPPAH